VLNKSSTIFDKVQPAGQIALPVRDLIINSAVSGKQRVREFPRKVRKNTKRQSRATRRRGIRESQPRRNSLPEKRINDAGQEDYLLAPFC
jgi:hypothetical protein